MFQGREIFPGVARGRNGHPAHDTRCGLTFVGTASVDLQTHRRRGILILTINYTRIDQRPGRTADVIDGIARVYTHSGNARMRIQGGQLLWSPDRVSTIDGGKIAVVASSGPLRLLDQRFGEYVMTLTHPPRRLPRIGGRVVLHG